LNKPTDEFCTALNIEVPEDNVNEFVIITGTTVANGKLCATTSFMIDYLWSTRITNDYFNLDFINGREDYFAAAAMAQAKVESDYFSFVTLSHYNDIAAEIVAHAAASEFTEAWHLINANGYWPASMRYEDYYFIEDPWTTYAGTLDTLVSGKTATDDYAAVDQAAWASSHTWGSLYTESEWPLNIQVITSIMSEADWHYWFGKANVKLSDILKAFSYFPSFCGEVYDADT